MKTAKALEVLKADPGLSNREAAKVAECDEGTVRRARARLGDPGGREVIDVPLSEITLDASTQSRQDMSRETVDAYAEMMADGHEFPPVELVRDDAAGTCYPTDGFHRILAAKKLGMAEIRAHVVFGTLDDAVLIAAAANATNALQRTVADKRRAVRMCLEHPESKGWSSRKLADHVGVSHTFVDNVRRELAAPKGGDGAEAVPASGKAKASPRPLGGPLGGPVGGELGGEVAPATLPAAEPDAGADGGESDAEFLASCDKVRSKLGEAARKRFDADALLYKRFRALPSVDTAVAAIKSVLGNKAVGQKGALHAFLNRFCSLSHPRHWKVCLKCNGQGSIARFGECSSCSGRGYAVDYGK